MKRTRTILIGSVIKEFFDRPFIASKVAAGRIEQSYRDVVGEQVAGQTTEIRLNGKILHIKITSSLIRQELFYRRDELRDELNRRAKVDFISAVIVK